MRQKWHGSTAHAPCIQYHLRGEQNTQATPLSRTPGHTPTLTPHKEQACHPLGSEQRSVCSHPLPPNKVLPEFLVWPLVNFYSLVKVKNPG